MMHEGRGVVSAFPGGSVTAQQYLVQDFPPCFTSMPALAAASATDSVDSTVKRKPVSAPSTPTRSGMNSLFCSPTCRAVMIVWLTSTTPNPGMWMGIGIIESGRNPPLTSNSSWLRGGTGNAKSPWRVTNGQPRARADAVASVADAGELAIGVDDERTQSGVDRRREQDQRPARRGLDEVFQGVMR